MTRLLGPLVTIWLVVVAWQIYSYSSISSGSSADAAVVLGAAVWRGRPSPVFEERIKHGINLYESGAVDYLVFTGGIGTGDTRAESEVAQAYALSRGVPAEKILIERNSSTTYENLHEACQVMAAADLKNLLIVSDPLHMKRALTIAGDIGLDAQPSPTPTTRYRTWRTQSVSLANEVIFYVVHMASRAAGLVENCPV